MGQNKSIKDMDSSKENLRKDIPKDAMTPSTNAMMKEPSRPSYAFKIIILIEIIFYF